MGSLCLSSASILRCESFSSFQSQVLIIPTALELIFSTTLIITNWGTGWRHLLLSAEGWSYFALALLELLSHTLPAVRDSVSVFSVVDIILGATSFLPILFYTLFVYLFTRGELIDTLPKRFQRIANVLLVVFIPAIVVLNELSSFVGISRGTLLVGGKQVVAIGFKNSADQQLWTFLTSLTLALLTAFEAINFCFAFYRLIRAFVDQRRIETTSTDSAHLFRGIGWISGGLKLGAVETVIGFAQGGFGGALTRRIIRFLARAFLIIGVVKGVDEVDDFGEVAKEMSRPQFRRSRIHQLISNPRLSTFRQLSPAATAFHNTTRAPAVTSPLSDYRHSTGGPSMAEFAQLKREVTGSTFARPPKQRVTVAFEEGAPTLQMRFSGLDIPSPAVIAENVKSRPVSSSWVSIAHSSRYAPSTLAPSFAFDPPAVPYVYNDFMNERDAQRTQHQRQMSQFSTRSSAYPDSLTAVRELASQFPGLPPNPTPISERGEPRSGWAEDVEAQRRPSRGKGKGKAREGYEEHAPRRSVNDSAYGGSVRSAEGSYYAQNAAPMPQKRESSPEPVLRYAYDGMEHPDSPEPVYRYSYDGPVSPEHVHPYAYATPMPDPESPTAVRHRTDTTLDNTPMTFLSPFEQGVTESPSTPGTENPFQYDAVSPALNTGMSSKAPFEQGVQQRVWMDDGPHGAAVNPERRTTRTSAALLQMTQRGDGGVHEAWTPAEFTPSILSMNTPSIAPSEASSKRHSTLKKKRRPSVKGRNAEENPAASVDTLASSWLHGEVDVDDEHPSLATAVRVKTVGRVKAPRKATPAPVNAKHGMTRGSVYIQPITVPPSEFSSEVQIIQGPGSGDSIRSGDSFIGTRM
ncbi:hypothetical protein B0H10DRAFT_2005803 [Mycena sp. CBHHK59/15]|nr:hypothetical protein B0H10DRAFT_2005803 [Mycena sp. CBHHK59/15]